MATKSPYHEALGQRIRALRGQLSLRQFAERVGSNVKFTNISRWERGERIPDAQEVLLICEAFEVDPKWLLTGEGVAPAGTETPSAELGHSKRPETLPEGLGHIPVVSSRPSAGAGSDTEGGQVEATIEVDLAELGRSSARGLKAVRVRGDSMQPRLHDGDTIIVDTLDTELRDDVWVLERRDELVVKRLQELPTGGWRVISDNPAYPPVELRAEDRPVVFGRVLRKRGGWERV